MDAPPLNQRLSSGLYIAATPIGNLGDITMRCIDLLRRCDLVACEDTRVAGKLMQHLGLKKRLWRYDDHSSNEDRERLLAAMHEQAVALISDAGTPLVSDPGYRLVRAARIAGIPVTSLPGPCAAILGLTMSGLPNDRFVFAGFVPSKGNARREYLAQWGGLEATAIFYETAPRLLKTLSAINVLWPDRTVAVARELTKLHEECRIDKAAALVEHYERRPAKGEIVLLLAPATRTPEPIDVDAALLAAMQDHKPSQAAALVAQQTGEDRKTLYSRAMVLRGA